MKKPRNASLTVPAPPPRGNKTPPPNNYPTLDLHGYHKDAAIRAVTDFLDRQSSQSSSKHRWVLIITGTGSHSPHGPVLRTAVESLLTRRNMTYQRNTPGSFLVQPQSGEVWYTQHQAIDTKVVISANESQDPLVRLRQINSQPKRQSAPQHLRSGGDSSDGTASTTSSLSLWGGPSVLEVAQDEANLARAKEASRAEAVEHARQTKRAAKEDLEQALRASLVLSSQQEKDDAAAFDAVLQQALVQSQQEDDEWRQQEDALLQQTLEQSQREALEASQREDALLRQTIEQSQKEALEQSQREEALLQQALDASAAECVAGTSSGTIDARK